MKSKYILLFVVLTLIGGILRFYNLSWGSPFFFHPDERNIASAILNIDPAGNDFNPNFFAYGSLPIYLTYVTGETLNFLTKTPWLTFERIILLGRFISATLSTLLILLVYLVTKTIADKSPALNSMTAEKSKPSGEGFCVAGINPDPADAGEGSLEPGSKKSSWPLIAAALTAFTPGLIQYAHFSTFEIILTFEYLLVLYSALKMVRNGRLRDYLLCAFVIGTSIATKIVSLAIVPILPLAHFLYLLRQPTPLNQPTFPATGLPILTTFRNKLTILIRIIVVLASTSKNLILAMFLLVLTAFILSPYNVLDYPAFRHSMNYEGGVATGQTLVFYTAQFLETIPVVFQLKQVFPYILGWPLTIFSIISFGYLTFKVLNVSLRLFKPSPLNTQHSTLILLWTLPTLYLIFHFTLFVKWTRYMIPVLPFLIIISVIVLHEWCQLFRKQVLFKFLTIALLVSTIFSGLAFFTIYLRPDTRINAAIWASENIPQDAKILSEVWDMGITPFNNYFEVSNITLFNFYELNTQGEEITNLRLEELTQLLEKSNYIIIPSKRIYNTRLRLPQRFPLATRYYQTLFDGSLGFTKVTEFDSAPVLFFEQNAEETFKVFDHPKVSIFRKANPLTRDEYVRLLEAKEQRS